MCFPVSGRVNGNLHLLVPRLKLHVEAWYPTVVLQDINIIHPKRMAGAFNLMMR